MARRVARGDIRLCEFPAPDKPRPVLVLTRDWAAEYLTRLTVAPITSSIRDVPSQILLTESDGMKHACAVNLHNLVTVDKTRLGRRVAQLAPQRMREVCDAMAFALGCDGVPETKSVR
ncbi:MAG: type II toxin-antitoxin system PemK/MazF family toxin [Acidobacteriota bacterium]